MHDYSELKSKAEKELGKYAMEEAIPVSAWEKINIISGALKNLCKIEMYEDGGEYSERYARGSSYNDRYYDIKGSYEGDRSYANRRRDSMGRYTSRNSRDYSGARRYSRDEAKDSMIDMLNDLMEDATTDKERTALMRCKAALQDA